MPPLAAELFAVSTDASVLWSRWALRRLSHLIAGSPAAFARDLEDGKAFTRLRLRGRLEAADLANQSRSDQRLIGIAMARRAMQGTFVAREDGVEACAESRDLERWPFGYREGVVEGLFLDAQGYLDASPWGVALVPHVLCVHPDAGAVLRALVTEAQAADPAVRFDKAERDSVAQQMNDAAHVFDAGIRPVWNELADVVRPK